MQTSVFIATSLDGFIARTDGGIDWLTNPAYNLPDEDFGYKAFMESVDALVMGRNTYETVRNFAEWPYGNKRVVVLSSQALTIPSAIAQTVEAMAAAPAEVVAQLADRGLQHLYVDGGQTIQRFLAAGLIQQMIITRIPILLGQGIPLFGAFNQEIKLRHSETRSFANGFVQSRYEVEG